MDFFKEIDRVTAAYRAGAGLPSLTESSPADLREALLIEQDRGTARPRRLDKAGGDVVVPFRKREE